MKMFFAAAALLLGLGSCCSSKNMPLEGPTWKLAQMAGIPSAAIEQETDSFTLQFSAADKMVAGRTNCNRFFGGYELKGAEIDFKDMGMTRMACPDMQYESAFVEMLDEADRYKIRGSELTLFDDGRALASFRVLPVPAEPITK